MATTNEPATRAFNSLSAIYDALDGTDIREDFADAGIPKESAEELQEAINLFMTHLEDTLPGLQMMVDKGVE